MTAQALAELISFLENLPEPRIVMAAGKWGVWAALMVRIDLSRLDGRKLRPGPGPQNSGIALRDST